MKPIVTLSAALFLTTVSADYLIKQPIGSGVSFSSQNESIKPSDVSQDDFDFLKSEISFTAMTKCYDSSVSGSNTSSGADMFAACSGKGPIVAMATFQGHSFGGYIPIDLNTNPNTSRYYSDNRARLFNFNTNTAYQDDNGADTIYIRNHSNPYIGWGNGHDLVLFKYANSSYPYGYCYTSPYRISSYNNWTASYCMDSGWNFSSYPTVKVYNVN